VAEDPGYQILVADDERVVREVLFDLLSDQGYSVTTVCDGREALDKLRRHNFDLIMADLRLPVVDGIALLDEIARMRTKIATIIITGHGTVETALAAMKKGAYDYIIKPFKVEEILRAVERALESARLEKENVALREALSLYRISEAMSSSLSLDKVLRVIVEAALWEADADQVVLHFREWLTGRFVEKISLPARNRPSSSLSGRVRPEKILDRMGDGPAVLLHDDQARALLNEGGAGQEEVVSFLAVPLKTTDAVVGLLNAFSFTPGYYFSEGQSKTFSIMASRAAVAIENARLHESLQESVRQAIESLAAAIETKDPYIHGHSQRVTGYAQSLATTLGLGRREVEVIGHAAMVHDIGKIGLRYEALNKPGKLTPEEWRIVKLHTELGRQILEPMTFFHEIIPIVYFHHERFDGAGFPSGRQGNRIPMGARILTVADAYDAMTSDRTYRNALSTLDAVGELMHHAGSQFDPDLVAHFADIVQDLVQSADEEEDRDEEDRDE